MFFGLGVNVKFPANYRESPFTIIASGITTLPQRLRFPFSLIRPGDPQLMGVPARLNEIVPGWIYSRNAYALDRNMYKYSSRGKGLVPCSFFGIFSAETVRQVFDARNRLQVEQVRDVYTQEHIDGLGENFMRERVRQGAIAAYEEYLERYLNREISRMVRMPETLDELVKRFRQLEKDWFENVFHGLDRDNERGRKIFDDYDSAHPVDKGFLEWERARFEDSVKRLNNVLKNID